MPHRVLTTRQLNRALLARQMLLERQPLGVLETTEKLGGLQAQIPNPPYLALWTRLQSMSREEMTRLQKVIAGWQDELELYENEDGKLLYDLPGAPLPDAETPAPVRLVTEYDNLVIAHKDRTRIISDANYPKIFQSAARVFATVLIDGFVAGSWKVETDRTSATLRVTPFQNYSDAERAAIIDEGKRLLAFMTDGELEFQVVFAE